MGLREQEMKIINLENEIENLGKDVDFFIKKIREIKPRKMELINESFKSKDNLISALRKSIAELNQENQILGEEYETLQKKLLYYEGK